MGYIVFYSIGYLIGFVLIRKYEVGFRKSDGIEGLLNAIAISHLSWIIVIARIVTVLRDND